VLDSMTPGEMKPIVPGLLSLVFVRNPHGAMGLFGEHPALLIALSCVVLVLLALLLRDGLRRSPLVQVGFGVVAGGAVANVIDRLTHGYVIDFIAARGFYVFNVADACITLGVATIVLGSWRAPAVAT
jgi:signal peptidase II